MCLSYLYDKIKKDLYSGLLTRMVFIDLQRAFDTIDHNILIKKVPFLAFNDKTIKWYTSYLSKRKFIIGIENTY